MTCANKACIRYHLLDAKLAGLYRNAKDKLHDRPESMKFDTLINEHNIVLWLLRTAPDWIDETVANSNQYHIE
jgi:hypothetical protein